VIANSERQLNDEKFMSKAPAKVIDTLRTKLAEYQAQLKKIKDGLDSAS
jgi:valyl-tRNA synthetase